MGHEEESAVGSTQQQEKTHVLDEAAAAELIDAAGSRWQRVVIGKLAGLTECWHFLLSRVQQAGFLPDQWRQTAARSMQRVDVSAAITTSRPMTRLADTSLLLVCTTLLGFILLELFSPFGLADAAQARSQQISARLLAPFYRSEAQNHIAVVLIDDHTIDYRQVGWPPEYVYYSDVLRRVLDHQPRAVFLDVMVEHPRPYDSSLADARKELYETLAGSEVPVLLAVSAPGRQSLLGSQGTSMDGTVTSWRNLGGSYPLVLKTNKENAEDAADESQVFDLASGIGEQAIADAIGDTLPLGPAAANSTPAWQLYRSVCATGGAGCREPAALTEKALIGDRDSAAMHVRWGVTKPVLGAAQLASMGEDKCYADKPSGLLQKMTESMDLVLYAMFSGLFGGLDESRRPRCPYALTINEDQLDVLPWPGDPQLVGERSLLQDRVVLIGTRLQGAHDLVDTSVQAKMPGVYLHAMALDNLMRWGQDVSDVPSKLRQLLLQLMVGVLLAMLFAWFWVNEEKNRKWMVVSSQYGLLSVAVLLPWASVGLQLVQKPSIAHCFMVWGGGLALIMAVLQHRCGFRWWVAMPFVIVSTVACMTSMLIVSWLRMPPPDWLGLLALSSAMFLFLHER